MERTEIYDSFAFPATEPSCYEPVVRDGVTWNRPRQWQGKIETGRSEPIDRAQDSFTTESASITSCILPRQCSFFGLFRSPWARWWKWTLAASASASAFLLIVGDDLSSQSLLFLGAAFGSLAIPATMTVLFAEWDITRRTTLPVVAGAALSGCVAAYAAGLANVAFGIAETSLSMAAVVEEPIKGLVVFLLAAHARNPKCILSGLAVGCAVGAGFAAIETLDYVYRYGEASRPSMDVLLTRGLLAPFMHAAWTAALGGAIWAAHGVDGGWRRVFASPAVYLVFAGMTLCHAVWNTGFLFWASLGVVSWLVLMVYVQKGIKQAFDYNLVAKEFWK